MRLLLGGDTPAVSSRTRTSRILRDRTVSHRLARASREIRADRASHCRRSRNWDVLGVGCNSVDFVYRLPAAPRADSPTAKMRITQPHGDRAAARRRRPWPPAPSLGLRAGYLGAIGGDDNGQRVKAELERRGVDVSQVLTRERPAIGLP